MTTKDVSVIASEVADWLAQREGLRISAKGYGLLLEVAPLIPKFQT